MASQGCIEQGFMLARDVASTISQQGSLFESKRPVRQMKTVECIHIVDARGQGRQFVHPQKVTK